MTVVVATVSVGFFGVDRRCHRELGSGGLVRWELGLDVEAPARIGNRQSLAAFVLLRETTLRKTSHNGAAGLRAPGLLQVP
eukprot:COSAG03_NODE_5392_length_1259_cov_132.290517_4_plen_80_part_01